MLHAMTVCVLVWLRQGVKLSLFDVGDVSQPREAYFTVVGGRGSTSEVLDDHKAFLFDVQRQLVTLPLTYYTDMFPSYGSRTFMVRRAGGVWLVRCACARLTRHVEC